MNLSVHSSSSYRVIMAALAEKHRSERVMALWNTLRTSDDHEEFLGALFNILADSVETAR